VKYKGGSANGRKKEKPLVGFDEFGSSVQGGSSVENVGAEEHNARVKKNEFHREGGENAREKNEGL